MRTDITTIDSNGNGVQLALNRIEGLADVGMLVKKDRLHLRLLAEETFSMVTAIVGEFSAKFWAESGEDEYRIILQADADITEQEEAQLLSVSSSGENSCFQFPAAGRTLPAKASWQGSGNITRQP